MEFRTEETVTLRVLLHAGFHADLTAPSRPVLHDA